MTVTVNGIEYEGADHASVDPSGSLTLFRSELVWRKTFSLLGPSSYPTVRRHTVAILAPGSWEHARFVPPIAVNRE